MDATIAISDDALMTAFETNTIAPVDWTHQAHVRVAYVLLSRHDLSTATDAMRRGLQSLNARHGAPTNMLRRGYHETITVVFMQLIHNLLARSGPFPSSLAFCDAFPAIFSKNFLGRFYSEDRLWSWDAKRSFVEPDLRSLDVAEFETAT